MVYGQCLIRTRVLSTSAVGRRFPRGDHDVQQPRAVQRNRRGGVCFRRRAISVWHIVTACPLPFLSPVLPSAAAVCRARVAL